MSLEVFDLHRRGGAFALQRGEDWRVSWYGKDGPIAPMAAMAGNHQPPMMAKYLRKSPAQLRNPVQAMIPPSRLFCGPGPAGWL